MDQPALEGKQARQDLSDLLESSAEHEGQKGSHKGKNGHDSHLGQPCESLLVVFGLEDVLLENVGEEGEGGVEVDVLEVEQAGVEEGALEELLLLDEVTELMEGWDWGDVGYGMGIGSLNQSFVIDNIFLPH